nr:hypothetical protein JVH1_8884 [Rhodococcus sp. JVH1]
MHPICGIRPHRATEHPGQSLTGPTPVLLNQRLDINGGAEIRYVLEPPLLRSLGTRSAGGTLVRRCTCHRGHLSRHRTEDGSHPTIPPPRCSEPAPNARRGPKG